MAVPLIGIAGAALAAYGAKYYAELPSTLAEDQVKNYSLQPESELPPIKNRAQQYFINPEDEAEIMVAKEGLGSLKPETVYTQFKKAVNNMGGKTALVACDNVSKWTWKEYYDVSIASARSFVKLGLSPFGTVAILGFNSPEWFFANMGAIGAGAKAAGIYTTNGPEAAGYIVNHAKAEIIVCENPQQLEKFIHRLDQLPSVKAIVMWSGVLPEEAKGLAVPVYTWGEFIKLGEGDANLDKEVETRLATQRPGHCCTLIYTSGTTGDPKAVMISHDNLNWTAQCVIQSFPGFKPGPHHFVSYLPLSHVAAQMLDIHAPINTCAENMECTVYFARPDALKGTLGDTLKKVRPTGFFGVPRVWEKIQEKMAAIGATTTGMKKTIATWAKETGNAKWQSEQLPEEGSRTRPSRPVLTGVADALVFKKVRQGLGFDRCDWFISGAAPITRDTLSYFGSLDIHIMEVYGMSESTGPSTLAMPTAFRVGTVGPAIKGVEIKLDHQEGRDKEGHGEICYRGRNVMMGYMHNHDKTREAIDDDGFLHSGDVGHMDEFGLVAITGRIKELIITAGGENIAPVPIEDTLKSELPGISNVMMVGDKRKYNVCLVTLNTKMDEETGTFTNELVGNSLGVNGSSAKTTQEARKDPLWQTYITEGIKRTNAKAVSNAQKIQKFAIIDEDFSDKNGDLTPTLKLKRAVVVNKYADVIDALYQ